jgi:hypothetical protein
MFYDQPRTNLGHVWGCIYMYVKAVLNKGNNKITELRT